MKLPSSKHRLNSTLHNRPVIARQRGFGLMQAMLLTMLVGGTIAAAALVIHSKKPTRQIVTQQEQLRWADEALAAYAAAYGRLPCPATRWDEDPRNITEDCTASAGGANASVGYLPIALLYGARELDLGTGPIRYSVATGTTTGGEQANPLSQLEDIYLPRDPLGEVVEDYSDPGDPATQIRNGLDLCASLHINSHPLASLSSHQSVTRDGDPFNYAYALIAAGPTVGNNDRFDTALDTKVLGPSHSSVDYDDRSLVRSFESLAQAAGCRQYAVGQDVAPSSVSLLAMDMLAASVANHVTVANFQDNNIGNGEVQVQDAAFAQTVAIAGLALNAGGLADIISSATWNSIDAVRSVITCIASLGVTCFEVPFKAAGVVGSVLAVSSSIVALALNSASMIPVSMALDANVKARDRAVNSVKPPVESVEAALNTIRDTLYGSTRTYCKTRYDASTGQPVQKRDSSGNPVTNEHGGIVYECDEVTEFVPGMDKDVESAREQERKLVAAAAVYQTNRLAWFSDTRIINRVNEGQSLDRYRDTHCTAASDGPLTAGCGSVAGSSETAGYKWVQTFNRSRATTEAIAKRNLAEKWSLASLDVEDAQNEVDQKQKDLNGWKDLVKLAENDATANCARAVDDLGRQVCANSRAQVHYMQTCTYTDGNGQLHSELNPSGGGGPNLDGQCTPIKQLNLDQAKSVLRDMKTKLANAKSTYDAQVSPYLEYPTNWLDSMVKADASVPSFTWITTGGPHYFPAGTNGRYGYRLAEDTAQECVRFNGGNIQFASQCSTYPYSRAYIDWIRANEAADDAKRNRIELEAQFEKLKKEYEELQSIAAPGGAAEELLAVGADAILRKADSRGAVGPNTVDAP